MKAKIFDEIAVGDHTSFTITIDQELHDSFTKLSGDDSPIHTDEVFSKNTQFKKPIGYAFMLTALLSRLYGKYLPGGSSVCLKQETSFIRPYYIGDTIEIKGKVIEKMASTRCVVIETILLRKEDIIMKGKGIVQVLFGEKT